MRCRDEKPQIRVYRGNDKLMENAYVCTWQLRPKSKCRNDSFLRLHCLIT